MGTLYTDASARIMVPPVLWKAVLGDYMKPVFGISSAFGDWHDGESTGKQLEKQGTFAITARANIPFAEWVAQESNKRKDFLRKNPDTRKHWQAEAHSVRAIVVCFCLRSSVSPLSWLLYQANFMRPLKTLLPEITELKLPEPAPGCITPAMLEEDTLLPLASAYLDWNKAGLPALGHWLAGLKDKRLRDVVTRDPHSIIVVRAPDKAPCADTWAIHLREPGSRPLVYMYQFKDHVADSPKPLSEAAVEEELVKAVGWARGVALLGEDKVKLMLGKGGGKQRTLQLPDDKRKMSDIEAKRRQKTLQLLDGFLDECDVLFVLVTDKKVPGTLPPGVVRTTRQQLLGSVFGPV